MPAKSAAQQRFMGMCDNNPGAAKGKCPPKKVAEEFAHKPPGGYSPAPKAAGTYSKLAAKPMGRASGAGHKAKKG